MKDMREINLAQTGGTSWSAIADVSLDEPPQEWAREIIERAKPKSMAEGVLRANGRIYEVSGNYGRLPLGTAMTEPSSWTTMSPGSTDFEAEDFDIDDITYSLSRYGFRSEIARDAIKDWAPVGLNVMRELRNEMVTWLNIKKDRLIVQDDTAADASGSSLTVVYSGSDNTIESGETLTPGDFNEALVLIEENNRANDGDLVAFLHPRQVQALRDDSQFTNASEYGDNEIVMTGEIGKYLGVRVIPTTNVKSFGSGAASFNTDGYEGLMMNAKYAYAVATNDPLWIEIDKDPSQTLTEVNASFTYSVSNIDTSAAVLVCSAKS